MPQQPTTKLKTAQQWMMLFGRTKADSPLDEIRPRLPEHVLPPIDFFWSVLSEHDIELIITTTLEAAVADKNQVKKGTV